MISLKYNSINYSKYLNNCDLNYKYFLKSIKETPVLEKIVFELPTNKLPNIETTEDDYQTRMLLKCFLAFYFMNFKMPYINCNNFKNKNMISGTSNSYHYAYLRTYTKITEKYELILLMLNENDRSNISIKNLTKLDRNIAANKYKTDFLNFRLEAQVLRIIEYRDILNSLFVKTELQKLKLKLNFIFKNFNNKMISINEFRNFFFFWNI